MSLESLERGVGRTIAVTGAAVGAYNIWAKRYVDSREARLPAGGLEQSIIPFYETLAETALKHSVEYTAVGGTPKQALRDPETEFYPDERRFTVWNPDGHTMKRATLYRPGEHTLRDFDVRAKGLGHEGMYKVADDSIPTDYAKELKSSMQRDLDEKAQELGFPSGPELSLFFYESPFGDFRPWHYATRTMLSDDFTHELLYSSNGVSVEVPVDEPWECVVELEDREIVIPTDSPRTLLGRTLTRPIVARRRDLDDVEKAVLNIRAKGLGDVLLGENWDIYEGFRRRLDTSLRSDKILKVAEDGGYTDATNLLLAKVAAPLAGPLESMVIAEAIRDPETMIGKLCAKLMGAA